MKIFKQMISILLVFFFLVPQVWCATYYADKAALGHSSSCSTPSDTDYDPITRECGSGSATVYDTIDGAINAATSAGDIIQIQPGAWLWSDGGISYNGVKSDNITVQGGTDNPINTIVDLNDGAASGRWIYSIGKTGFNLKYLTVRNSTSTAQAVLISTTTGAIVEWCIFKDNQEKSLALANSSGVLRYNIFAGIKGTGSSDASVSIGDSDFEIYYNEMRPSSNYLSNGYYITDSNTNNTTNFYNNIISGTTWYGINFAHASNSTISNNIFFGIGLNEGQGRQSVYGACSNVTASYNVVYTRLSGDTSWDTEITPTNTVESYAYLKQLPRTGYITLTMDDAYSVEETEGFQFLQDQCDDRGWHFTWAIDTYKWIEIANATYESKIVEVIEDGHDIGSHAYAHSCLTDITGMMNLTNNSGESLSVLISADTTNGGSPDWNGIYKDYTDWNGTITLGRSSGQGGGTYPAINLVIGGSFEFKTGIELAADISALADWTATATPRTENSINGQTGAIVLTDINTNIAGSGSLDLDVDKTEYLWFELKYGKDSLEDIIEAIIGEPYEVVSFVGPYNCIDDDVLDAEKEAGYFTARGKNGYMPDDSGIYLYDLNRFGIEFSSISGIPESEANGKASYVATIGGAYNIMYHGYVIDEIAEQEAAETVHDIFKLYENKGLKVGSQRDFWDWYEPLSTETTSGDGHSERRAYTAVDDKSNFNLTKLSSARDVGTPNGSTPYSSAVTDLNGNVITDASGDVLSKYGDALDMGAYELKSRMPQILCIGCQPGDLIRNGILRIGN